jgi:uncharacterized protein YjbI with pentapeptide repeats
MSRHILPAILLIALSVEAGQIQGVRNAPATALGMQRVVELHGLWLSTGGSEGARADLREISLEGGSVLSSPGLLLVGPLVLRDVNLSRADIRFARLRNVDLGGANLSGTEFNDSDLERAMLAGADLSGADFTDANLRGAVLREANLSQAILTNADLSGADLGGALCVSRDQISPAITDSATLLPEFEDCPAEP